LSDKIDARLGHLLTAIPLAHILGAAFYFWSYCAGFGAGIGAFSSAVDLVSVSLNDMAPVYLNSLLAPGALSLIRVTSKAGYSIDRANSLPEGEQRDTAIRTHNFMRSIIVYGICLATLIFVSKIMYDVVNDEPVNYFALQLIVIPFAGIGIMLFCEDRNYSKYTFEASAVITVFTLSIFFQGLDRGQTDRRAEYDTALKRHIRCDRRPILRSIGSSYLVALPSGRKALVNGDCAIKAIVPLTKDKLRAIALQRKAVRAKQAAPKLGMDAKPTGQQADASSRKMQ
jgi:hypothetical protein